METSVAVIGAGPAGLTAAYLLAKENIKVSVMEADPHYVGGIARTVVYKGYCFDIGGHRFFSKSKEVEDLWTEILPQDFLIRDRSSRIFYNKQFFSYPLKAFEAFRKLGLIETSYCCLSYLKARLLPVKTPVNFAEWVSNHFGYRLFSIFFKTYTEKVWGMRCEEVSSDWAAQRIKGLSLLKVIVDAFLPTRWRSKKADKLIKTLIGSFRYPRKGPGMLWEACATKVQLLGGSVLMDSAVTGCNYDSEKQVFQLRYQQSDGSSHSVEATHLISSAPLRDLVIDFLKPSLSAAALDAAAQLKYRDFLIVVLILKDKKQFDDNWIYIHEPGVDVARIQNFKSWSPEMVPDPEMCCYGMEYFCFENDGLWSQSDEQLIKKAIVEIEKIGLAKAADIVDGCVVRQAKAYPVYDEHYKENVELIRHELEEKYPNLILVGRNGMHKYNNQDHAMMTAMLAVKNILAGKADFNLWGVNQDAEYTEEGVGGQKEVMAGLRAVPQRIK